MKGKNLGLGIFIVSIGVLWLLFNFDMLNWSILNSLYRLWPLLLVMIGINIVFGNNQLVKSLGWIAFLIIIIAYSYFNNSQVIKDTESGAGNVSIVKEAMTKNGDIDLNLGGTNINLGSDTSNLIDALVTDTDIEHTVAYNNNNETADVKFFPKTKIGFINDGKKNNRFSIDLNKDVVWDMAVNVGAASGTLDMSGLKVKNLELKTGAVNLELKFGDKLQFTDVRISSGASNIEVVIPDNVGARVKFDGGLSSNNLKELGWINKDGYYVSPNFDQASSKINFDVDMGVGKFEIKK